MAAPDLQWFERLILHSLNSLSAIAVIRSAQAASFRWLSRNEAAFDKLGSRIPSHDRFGIAALCHALAIKGQRWVSRSFANLGKGSAEICK